MATTFDPIELSPELDAIIYSTGGPEASKTYASAVKDYNYKIEQGDFPGPNPSTMYQIRLSGGDRAQAMLAAYQAGVDLQAQGYEVSQEMFDGLMQTAATYGDAAGQGLSNAVNRFKTEADRANGGEPPVALKGSSYYTEAQAAADATAAENATTQEAADLAEQNSTAILNAGQTGGTIAGGDATKGKTGESALKSIKNFAQAGRMVGARSSAMANGAEATGIKATPESLLGDVGPQKTTEVANPAPDLSQPAQGSADAQDPAYFERGGKAAGAITDSNWDFSDTSTGGRHPGMSDAALDDIYAGIRSGELGQVMGAQQRGQNIEGINAAADRAGGPQLDTGRGPLSGIGDSGGYVAPPAMAGPQGLQADSMAPTTWRGQTGPQIQGNTLGALVDIGGGGQTPQIQSTVPMQGFSLPGQGTNQLQQPPANSGTIGQDGMLQDPMQNQQSALETIQAPQIGPQQLQQQQPNPFGPPPTAPTVAPAPAPTGPQPIQQTKQQQQQYSPLQTFNAFR